MNKKPIIGLEEVSKCFKKQSVINNLSMTVYENDIYGLLGPNGSGKTTIMKLILNMIQPDTGKIVVCGKSLDNAYGYENHNIGASIDAPNFYKHLSGRKNLEMLVTLYGLSKKRVDEVLEIVGLTQDADKKVVNYSMGMKQRLAIGRAILTKPSILILDEPTNGLDPSGFRAIRELIKKIANEENTTVLISTHILSEIEHICNRIGVLKNGVLISESYLCEVNQQIQAEEMSLEDYYIELIGGVLRDA